MYLQFYSTLITGPTQTAPRVDVIDAGAAVLTWLTETLVYIQLTHLSLIAWQAVAQIAIDLQQERTTQYEH